MGRSYQINKDSGNIVINGTFGVGLKCVYSQERVLSETIIRSACKLANKKAEIDEEIRLLYVAVTRAKEKLIIVGAYNFDQLERNINQSIYGTYNSLDMIFKSVEKSDYSKFKNLKEFTIFDGQESEASVCVHTYDEWDCLNTVNEHPLILSCVDEFIQRGINIAKNERPSLDTITIKNTVTNILREESDYENLNYTPKTLSPIDKVSNNDVLHLGTAYHTVMENLTFEENYIDVEDKISSLVSTGLISCQVAKDIKIEHILKAISTIKPLIEKSNKVYREKQFILCDNYNKLVESTDNNTKVIVQGVIDLVVICEDEVYLIDFKTNRGMSEDELRDKYSLQLKLYAHAFKEATNIAVTRKYLYSFYLGKLIETN